MCLSLVRGDAVQPSFSYPKVDGAFIADILGDAGHVNVGIVDTEVFGKQAGARPKSGLSRPRGLKRRIY
jgi:hypothetical protein